MINLLHLMPLQPGRVFHRVLEFRRFFAALYDIEPVTISPVLGNPPFIRGKQDPPGFSRNPSAFYEARLPGVQVEAGDVVTEVLLVNIVNLPALPPLMFHDHPHGNGLSRQVRLEAAHLRRLPFWMRQDDEVPSPPAWPR